jgi:hypothetical protein
MAWSTVLSRKDKMMRNAHLLIFAILYTPPEDTFDNVSQPWIDIFLPSFRPQFSVPINRFRCPE